MEVMRFYGWSWDQVMKTPVGAFWSCHRHVGRIRAKEALHSVFLDSINNLEKADRDEALASLKEEMGTVVIEKAVFDKPGWGALKSISNKG